MTPLIILETRLPGTHGGLRFGFMKSFTRNVGPKEASARAMRCKFSCIGAIEASLCRHQAMATLTHCSSARLQVVEASALMSCLHSCTACKCTCRSRPDCNTPAPLHSCKTGQCVASVRHFLRIHTEPDTGLRPGIRDS